MIQWAIVFLVLAVMAGILGFVWVPGVVATVAKLSFGILLMLCLAFFIAGLFLGGRTS